MARSFKKVFDTFNAVWEADLKAVREADLKDSRSPIRDPPAEDDDEGWKEYRKHLPKMGLGLVETMEHHVIKQKLEEMMASGAFSNAIAINSVYRNLVKLAHTYKDIDLREMAKDHIEAIASGNHSFSKSAFYFCPQLKTVLKNAIDKQDPWIGLKPRGRGANSRGGRKVAAERRREENEDAEDDTEHAAAGGGEDYETAPPAKRAKTTTSVAAPLELQEHQECTVCFDAKKDTLLRPCNHVTTCSTCAPKVGEPCPFCRRVVEEKMKVYI